MSPSYNHSLLQGEICYHIRKTKKFRPFSELTIVMNDKEYQPDISIYPWRELRDIDIIKEDEIPLVVIEIISPSQNQLEMNEKIQLYLNGGIQSVWLVDPYMRVIAVWQNCGVKRYMQGIIEDSTGVNLDVQKLFTGQD